MLSWLRSTRAAPWTWPARSQSACPACSASWTSGQTSTPPTSMVGASCGKAGQPWARVPGEGNPGSPRMMGGASRMQPICWHSTARHRGYRESSHRPHASPKGCLWGVRSASERAVASCLRKTLSWVSAGFSGSRKALPLLALLFCFLWVEREGPENRSPSALAERSVFCKVHLWS